MKREKRQLFNKKDDFKNSKQSSQKRDKTTACYKVNHSIGLLEFLLIKCKTSRNNVKSLLSSHKVLVNGGMVSKYDFLLAKDDEVKIVKHSINSPTKALGKKQIPKLPFSVIYEDEDFIAINKPCGLLSVESDNDRNCAFTILLNYFQSINKNSRPFILHRIDKETSGVLVFAKNAKIHSMLKMNWNDFVKVRSYTALVEGTFNDKEGTISTYLKENANNMVYSTHDKTGQKAVTHYSVIKENTNYSLLKINIDTGRKNQIRVHMKELGHSVVGDEKYGCNSNPINRLGLHATKLEFIHPVNKKLISIFAPTPEIFNKPFN